MPRRSPPSSSSTSARSTRSSSRVACASAACSPASGPAKPPIACRTPRAVGVRPLPDLRFYAEADWAFYDYGAPRPWEFQFGGEYSPVFATWFHGAPFLAVNVHLREDVDYSGLLTLQAGWQWRGDRGQLLRTGLAYSNGLSDHGQFYNRFEEQVGVGLWYDF